MFRREFVTAIIIFLFNSVGFKLDRPGKKSLIVHHSLFWLKNPNSKEDKIKLIENLKTLTKIENHRTLIGVPVETITYEGTDSSYDASLVTYFDNVKGRETYQNDPVHKAFIANSSNLWQKMISYDTFCEIP